MERIFLDFGSLLLHLLGAISGFLGPLLGPLGGGGECLLSGSLFRHDLQQLQEVR